MASKAIRHLDDDIRTSLRVRAAGNGPLNGGGSPADPSQGSRVRGKLPRSDEIEAMLSDTFGDRVLPFDSNAACACGYMAAARRSAGRRCRGAAVRFLLAAALAGLMAAACGESPVANRAPVATDDLSDAEMFGGDSLTVDLAGHFEDPDGDALRYEAKTSAPAAAGVAVAGSVLTVTALALGEATVTVTAHDPVGLTADQEFMVTVAVLRRLTNHGASGPAWSPDGTRIAFSSYRDADAEIYAIDADGSDVERMTNNSVWDVEPAWSPDGARIAFFSDRDSTWNIYVMDADGSDVERLTDNSAHDWWPAWSPDGARIAFSSSRNGIYVMDADGSGVKRLTNNGSYPAWSPDGARIAFVSDRAGGNPEIYVMNADGSDVERLTNSSGGDWDPAWSPDGTRIAFSSYRDGDAEIYAMDADGSNVERMTNNSASDSSPTWSPDGTRIAFSSNRDGDPQISDIYVMYIAVR